MILNNNYNDHSNNKVNDILKFYELKDIWRSWSSFITNVI